MEAAGALLLLVGACGSEVQFEDERSAEVPQVLRNAYLEISRARFGLVACRTPEQPQAIGGLDSARSGAEAAIAGRFAGLDMAALKQEADRETLAVQIERCAGEPGISRYRSAVDRLRQLAGETN